MIADGFKTNSDIGKIYGLLTVEGVGEPFIGKRGRTLPRVWCRCECGAKSLVLRRNLRSGNTKSCGCQGASRIQPGMVFTRLTVVAEANRDRDGILWACHCQCGKQTTVHACDLRGGKTRSCGCLRALNGKKPDGLASAHVLFTSYHRKARERTISFSLTFEQALRLFTGNCYLCGAAPNNVRTYRLGRTSFTHSGIDRIDNVRGYLPDNVASCCWACNNAKATQSLDDFLQWANRVKNHERGSPLIPVPEASFTKEPRVDYRGALVVPGARFAKLTVLADAGRKHRAKMWICRCDCGKEKVINGSNLRKGASRSCGCAFHGYKPGWASLLQMARQYHKWAVIRNLALELTSGQVIFLLTQPCYYCGCLPNMSYRYHSSGKGACLRNGIDRLDPALGYVEGNVVTACWTCNRAKASMSKQEFLDWVDRIGVLKAETCKV